MRTIFQSILATIYIGALLAPQSTEAAPDGRNYALSLTSYGTSIEFDGITDNLSGWGLTFDAVVAELQFSELAIRGTAARQKHDDFSRIDINAFELSLLWGRGLNHYGFNWAIGGGLFTEQWTDRSSVNFNGVQFSGGIGYNWDQVAINGWISLRDANAYKLGRRSADAAAAAGLAIGLRF